MSLMKIISVSVGNENFLVEKAFSEWVMAMYYDMIICMYLKCDYRW